MFNFFCFNLKLLSLKSFFFSASLLLGVSLCPFLRQYEFTLLKLSNSSSVKMWSKFSWTILLCSRNSSLVLKINTLLYKIPWWKSKCTQQKRAAEWFHCIKQTHIILVSHAISPWSPVGGVFHVKDLFRQEAWVLVYCV